jgi:hypothetical protein
MNQGYLGNTQVCFDLNDDGLCNIGEPTSTTNAQGAYALSVPTGHRGGNLLAVVRPDSADSAATTANPITARLDLGNAAGIRGRRNGCHGQHLTDHGHLLRPPSPGWTQSTLQPDCDVHPDRL